jgi:hypothetical protein
MKNYNYTVLYLEGFNKYQTFLLEAALEEQNVNRLFNSPDDVKDLIEAATEDQLRYIFYKIKNDLPSGTVTSFIDKCIDATKNSNYTTAAQKILSLFVTNYRIAIDSTDTRNVLKIYNAFHKPADLSQPPPSSFLQNFGAPYTTTTTLTSLTSEDPESSMLDTARENLRNAIDTLRNAGGAAATPAAASTAGYMGSQEPSNLSRRQAVQPISEPGGPTYYIRIGGGRFRPAVQADLQANIPLYMKNPNRAAAIVNPYVRVSDEIKRARRAGPVDQDAIDREMRAQGYQKVGPGGLRRERDGSIRRRSKLSGAAGSLSNFLGDIGNTLKGQ